MGLTIVFLLVGIGLLFVAYRIFRGGGASEERGAARTRRSHRREERPPGDGSKPRGTLKLDGSEAATEVDVARIGDDVDLPAGQTKPLDRRRRALPGNTAIDPHAEPLEPAASRPRREPESDQGDGEPSEVRPASDDLRHKHEHAVILLARDREERLVREAAFPIAHVRGSFALFGGEEALVVVGADIDCVGSIHYRKEEGERRVWVDDVPRGGFRDPATGEAIGNGRRLRHGDKLIWPNDPEGYSVEIIFQ